MNSEVTICDVTVALENTLINGDSDMIIKIPYQYNSIILKGVDVLVSNLDINTDNSDHCDEGFHQVEQICCNFSLGFVTKARACKGAGQK